MGHVFRPRELPFFIADLLARIRSSLAAIGKDDRMTHVADAQLRVAAVFKMKRELSRTEHMAHLKPPDPRPNSSQQVCDEDHYRDYRRLEPTGY
jgi:hypothetical protein